MQRIHLRDLQDGVLDVGCRELAGRHVALDDDAVEGAADAAQLQDFLVALEFELRDLAVLAGLAEFGFGQLALRARLVEGAGGDEVLLEELRGPLFLLEGEIEPGFRGAHRAFHRGLRSGQFDGGALGAGFEHHEDLPLLDRVAASHEDLVDDPLDRAADLDGVAGFDQAVVFLGLRGRCRGQGQERKGSANGRRHGHALHRWHFEVSGRIDSGDCILQCKAPNIRHFFE